MNIQSSLWFVLSFLLCSGSPPVHCDISSASHYSQKVSNSVLDLYIDIDSISSSTNRHSETTMTVTPDSSKVDFERAPIVPTHIYPYLLLALWVTCITCVVCCCLYCKCQQAESMTAYNSNGFELREVHVQNHPLPHVQGCVCLGCLQRQIAKEMQLKREY
ncbi:uncharacterized protein Dmoj_GI26940, isoform C [Drosophila mojavensis]|uniref:Uncharacterized protein, isoform C n=2 Tax=Drosophila mojavensis TaxID=7230 RepID=A0A0Q9XAC9_DROMO|nr:uncharacterized protein Dmoj_GI26940, isoform C [Drosophila mojavensis]